MRKPSNQAQSAQPKPMYRMLIYLAWLLPLLSFNACNSETKDIQETRFIMGTLVTFTIDDSNAELAKNAIHAAADVMQGIEDKFTIYGNHGNAVKTFNHAPIHTPFPFDDDINQVLQTAIQIEQQSQGAFNPALGKLDKLWGFSSTNTPHEPPSDKVINQYRQHIEHCIQSLGHQQWMRKNNNCQLDFGAIAKGFAIDQGIYILKKYGIQNAMINAGGDMRLIGTHHGKPWRIGIRHPRNKEKILATLSLSGDVSIVTSGDYERYFIYQGKRYHHILNPHTGFPSHASQSTTVIAKNATLADAWSTALFVQGAAGLPQLTSLGYAALIVDQQGHIHTNPLMASQLQSVSN